MTNSNKVSDDMVVSIDYKLQLEDGEVVDQSTTGEPLVYLQGAGNIIPGLEEALNGLAVGAKKKVVVQPEEGYGEHDPEAFQVVPRHIFPDDVELKEGMGLRLVDRDTGQPVIAYVASIREEEVMLDFNHPLAGETLHFQVEVVDMREATDEELEHGHPHTGEGGH